MSWIRVLGASAVASLALGAFSASGASAASSLFVKAEGKVLSKGTAVGFPVSIGPGFEECSTEQAGTLKANGKPKDKVGLTAALKGLGCEGGSSLAGSFKDIELTGSGEMIVKGKVTLTLPGPCAYEVKSAEAKFTPPAVVGFSGQALGKRAKGSSNSCAATEKLPISMELFDSELTGLPQIEVET